MCSSQQLPSPPKKKKGHPKKPGRRGLQATALNQNIQASHHIQHWIDQLGSLGVVTLRLGRKMLQGCDDIPPRLMGSY